MATAYDQIKNGLLRETDILQQEIPILNEKFNISTENAELKEGKITLSVSDALSQMITISDNYAALLLSEKVRLSNVAKFLTSNGFTESKVGTDGSIPTTTPSDIAKFFTLLYQGTLIDKEYDEKMLDLLKGQQLNHKIPKNLPKDILVAHKTGELGYFTHDAGIVYAPKNDYVIVVLSETKKPLVAEQKIADISEAVYRYFTE
jgi:beta-lactamase class A